MKFWLITVGEPIPGDSPNPRYLRTGILADCIVRGGDEVVWWNSTFNHFDKHNRTQASEKRVLGNGVHLHLLHGRDYQRNISFARIRNHRDVAAEFRRLAPQEPTPDIVVCSFPTIELSVAAVEYGKKRGIPVILDVRDLWPDIFIDLFPRFLRPLARLPLLPMVWQTRKAFRGCEAIVAVSESYLKFGLRYANRKSQGGDRVVPIGYREVVFDEESLARGRDWLTNAGVQPTKFIFWFIGFFGYTYELHPFIKVAQAYQRENNDNIQFVFSGKGERLTEWQSAARGLRNVVFTGSIDGEKIGAMMEMADIGLAAYAPGAPQGLPNKIFEYLSAGLPVLSSLKGETEALLSANRCGRTYDPNCSEQIKIMCDQFYFNEKERSEFAHRAKKLFGDEFSADRVYSSWIGHLRKFRRGSVQEKSVPTFSPSFSPTYSDES